MSFATLAVIGLIGILGPLLALPVRWHVPVVIGELVAGVGLGRTGIGYLHSGDPTFTLLADVGFALVMFVAGTHVPMRDPALRPALRVGALRAVVVGVVAAALGFGLSTAFGTGHAAMYAVLMASSSAALILPIVDSLGLGGEPVLQLLPQIAIADAACIVALPLAIDPAHAVRAAGGAAAVIAVGLVVYAVLRQLELRGLRKRAHNVSEERKFALELRVQLVILFGLAALAVWTHVSIMLAGFVFGLGVSAMGEPRRLAKQLFALSEGLFGPLFFVWLGSSLDLRALGSHPNFIVLGALLGVGAVAAIPFAVYWRGPGAYGLLAVIGVMATLSWYLVGAGGSDPRVLEGSGATLLGIAWIGGLGSAATAMARIPDGRALLLTAVFATVAYDVGGLFVGKAIGHRPLSAASPNKTLEGTLGGMGLAFVTAIVIAGIAQKGPYHGAGAGIVLGIGCALAAPLGDLCQSLLKRDLGVKDMGSVLPGHGGVLDRFDGMLFVLPTVFWLAVTVGHVVG